MGKKQHSKDRMFITSTEWATEWGGAKFRDLKTPFKRLPFYCCACVCLPSPSLLLFDPFLHVGLVQQLFSFFSNVCKPVVYSSLHLLRAQWTLLSLPDPENMHIPVHCTCISLHTTPVVHLGNSPRGYVCLSVYCMAWCGEVWQMIYTVLECFVFKYPKKNLSEQPHTLKNCIARQALAWLLLKKPANN